MAHEAKPLPLLRLAGIVNEVRSQATVTAAQGAFICRAFLSAPPRADKSASILFFFGGGWRLSNAGVIVG